MCHTILTFSKLGCKDNQIILLKIINLSPVLKSSLTDSLKNKQSLKCFAPNKSPWGTPFQWLDVKNVVWSKRQTNKSQDRIIFMICTKVKSALQLPALLMHQHKELVWKIQALRWYFKCQINAEGKDLETSKEEMILDLTCRWQRGLERNYALANFISNGNWNA